MWIIRISLDLCGEKFSPKKLLNDLSDKVHIFSANESNDFKDINPKEIFGFGSLSILCPKIYGLQYEISDYENWYLDFIEKNKTLLEDNHVTEINLFIDLFHDGGQLNFEIFSRELLKKIGKYEIAIPFSYYRLSTEQIIEMLNDTNISKRKFKKYIDIG